MTEGATGRISSAIALPLLAALIGCSGSVVTPTLQHTTSAPTYFVAVSGSDANPGTLRRPFRTIQRGLNIATVPGATVFVRAGTYHEGITFPADGTLQHPILLTNYPNERPFITGSTGAPQKLVRIFDRRHVRFVGFDVGNLTATTPTNSGAIFVEGYGDDIQISGNTVHDVKPAPHKYANGRGIQVRGYYSGRALTNVLVQDNEVERCTVQDGNVVEISGNAAHVRVIGNRMADNSGIALNVTGGTDPPSYRRWRLQVHDVIVADNVVDSTFGSGAIGVYIQASHAVEVRHNRVSHSAWGLYVTSEYPHVHSGDVAIVDNVVMNNSEAGVLVGSPFFPTSVLGATVTGNVVFRNGAYESGNGGNFGIGRARNVTVRENRLVAADNQPLTYLGAPYSAVTLDRNCYDDANHDPATAAFGYAGKTYVGFNRYRVSTGQDESSSFGRACDPPTTLTSPASFHITYL